MPYLEAISAIYKQLCNIDAYPIICDMALIKDAETLLDTINAVSLSFSGVELFGVSPERFEEFKKLFEKLGKKPEYGYINSNKKIEIDELLLQKKTYLTSNAIFSLIWRVALDCHIFGDLEINLNNNKRELAKLERELEQKFNKFKKE